MKHFGADRESKDYRGNFTLEITTTALCDMDCTYCFEGEKVDKRRLDKDLPTIYKRVDSLLADETWFQKHYDRLNISFWGGEPTLNPKFIIDIMNRYQDYEMVDFHIYTNAFNMHNMNKILDNVDTSRLHIQVSYDGKPINDKYRVTKNGRSTTNLVLDNLYKIAKKGVSVNLKATLPLDNMEVLLENWKDYKEIQEILWRVSKDINVNYAPTIDYVARATMETKGEALKVFRQQMLGIAKHEIEFFKEHGRHLCSWFGGEDTRKHCSAGLNMAAIDQAGDIYACHGAIYTDNKDELQSTTLSDEQFVENLAAFSKKFENPLQRISKTCQECVATTCMICPVISHERSEKEEFFDKWTDNWANDLCAFFQAFGEIDRAVQKHLYKEILSDMRNSENKITEIVEG